MALHLFMPPQIRVLVSEANQRFPSHIYEICLRPWIESVAPQFVSLFEQTIFAFKCLFVTTKNLARGFSSKGFSFPRATTPSNVTSLRYRNFANEQTPQLTLQAANS
jgi:hypothetical protein